jgi:hypothetical protein
VHGALADYVERRCRRVRWVRQQSQIAADSLRLPVPIRNAAFRACGDEMMRQRFHPLTLDPGDRENGQASVARHTNVAGRFDGCSVLPRSHLRTKTNTTCSVPPSSDGTDDVCVTE